MNTRVYADLLFAALPAALLADNDPPRGVWLRAVGLLPPLRVLDELDVAPDMPRSWRVSFAVSPVGERP